MPQFKCLTVRQPHAWGIVFANKDIENRGWRCFHRGWLAIHAGKTLEPHSSDIQAGPLSWGPHGIFQGDACVRLNDGTPVIEDQLIYGAVIGLAKVVNCVPPDDPRVRGNPHAEGPWCLVLSERRPLHKPFPISGQQGLWDVDLFEEYLTGLATPAIAPVAEPPRIPASSQRGCQLTDLPGGGRAFTCRRGGH